MKHSSATTSPQISSLDVLAARARAWLGLALSATARTRSRRPARMPVDCGPRMPLPPLKLTRSAPSRRNLVRFSRGGSIDAAAVGNRDDLREGEHARRAREGRDQVSDRGRLLRDRVFELEELRAARQA